MNKPSEKKPIIPELNIPDAADYQPSSSAFIKFAARAYVLIRTKPRIMAGSLAVLALTVASVAISMNGKVTTLPSIEENTIDVTSNIAPQMAMSDQRVDNTIENIDTDELRTSIKPLDLTDETNSSAEKNLTMKNEQNAVSLIDKAPETSEDSSTINDNTEPALASKNGASEVALDQNAESNEVAPMVFSERFGQTSSPMTEAEAQQVLKEGLSKIGSLEQSIDNLKSFPFDLVIKPDAVEPKHVILRIAEGTEATSGFWREIEAPVTTGDKGKKKPANKREEHFLVLNAIDENTGKPVAVDVKDMDSGETKKETSWAVLIPEKQFMDFAQSKQDDGTFAKPVLGRLDIETGEISWEIDTDGRALINWKDFAE